jgi:hypothetical protein
MRTQQEGDRRGCLLSTPQKDEVLPRVPRRRATIQRHARHITSNGHFGRQSTRAGRLGGAGAGGGWAELGQAVGSLADGQARLLTISHRPLSPSLRQRGPDAGGTEAGRYPPRGSPPAGVDARPPHISPGTEANATGRMTRAAAGNGRS